MARSPTAASKPSIAKLMSGSLRCESPLRIGFLGPEGTFSHLRRRKKIRIECRLRPPSPKSPASLKKSSADTSTSASSPSKTPLVAASPTPSMPSCIPRPKFAPKSSATIHHNLMAAKSRWEKDHHEKSAPKAAGLQPVLQRTSACIPPKTASISPRRQHDRCCKDGGRAMPASPPSAPKKPPAGHA